MPGSRTTNTVQAAVDWMTRSPVRAFAVVFVVAFAVRCTLLLFTPPEYVRPGTPNEPDRVAQTLLRTGQYADPYFIPTGPTAHPLPVYTGLLALLYGIFGLTLTAGYVRCLLNIASTAAMFALMPWLAGRLGAGAQAGVVGGLAGALFPYQGLGEILNWAGNDPYAAIALGALLVALVGRWTTGHGTTRGAFLIGLGWGAAFHLAPALLPVMLGCLAFESLWSRERRRWRAPAVMALGAALACAPWAWRNYAAFHEVFFVRSNFGLELRLGNHVGTAATWDALAAREGKVALRHPGGNPAEALRVRQLGEMAYMREARTEATTWIRTHPAAFVRLAAQRVKHVWLGPLDGSPASVWLLALTVLALLGAWRLLPALAAPQRAALLIPLALFPLVYYVVPYYARYRAPLDWILLTFAGAAVWRWIGGGAPAKDTPGAGLGGAGAAGARGDAPRPERDWRPLPETPGPVVRPSPRRQVDYLCVAHGRPLLWPAISFFTRTTHAETAPWRSARTTTSRSTGESWRRSGRRRRSGSARSITRSARRRSPRHRRPTGSRGMWQ